METLFYHFSQLLGITIIHSLWQGLIVYMLLRMYLQCFNASSASARYKVAFAALSATSVWFFVTLVSEISKYNWHPEAIAAVQAPLTVGNVIHQFTAPDSRYSFAFAGYMPYVTMLYLAGLVFNILKMLLAWNNIYRIRQNTTVAGFQQEVARLSAKPGLRKKVTVAFSEWVDVPCITGFIKPVILMPFTIGNYLNADEITAILLHEMAHIKRNDYLMNLLQQVIQILLFFNPFARLIGNIINQERESSCDDAVVKVTGSPLVYAQALLKLEENKQQQWHLALAAAGKKYHLLNRIERIMTTKKNNLNIRPVLVALVLLTFSLTSLAWFNPKMENGRLSVKAVVKPNLNEIFADTTRKVKSNKSVKVKPAKSTAGTKKSRIVINGNYTDSDFDDPKLNALTAEVDKHAQAIDKFYNSEEFKKLERGIDAKSKNLDALYNSGAIKTWERKLQQKSAELDKIHNDGELKDIQKQMEAYGDQISKYYESPEYLKLQGRLTNLSVKLAAMKYGTPAYTENLKELTQLSKKVGEYATKPEMQEVQKQMAEASKKMTAFYSSDHYKALQATLNQYSDSLRRTFDNPEMKGKQAEIRRLSQAMTNYQKRPEIKRHMDALKQAQARLTDYMKTPAFKQRLKEHRSYFNGTTDGELKEKPEAPEKPEQPEKVEPVEQR